MRSLAEMDTIQIEITNACRNQCSNCTRFCGHVPKPYMMSAEQVREAVDSLAEFPQMVGIMGGEPLLHPQFEQICEYALSKIPRERLGLWSTFPEGHEDKGECIAKTFGNIFLNDHTMPGIYHAPILVNPFEVIAEKDHYKIWHAIDRCWVQNSWSAAINPNGAFFCEIAAALSILFKERSTAWPVVPGWWKRTPKDYVAQMNKFCSMCGCALPFSRRESIDGRDDVSPLMFEALKKIGSRKLDKCVVGTPQILQQPQEMAAYKDQSFRDHIAARYGISLKLTDKGFLEPIFGLDIKKSLFSLYREEFESCQRDPLQLDMAPTGS